MAEQNSDRTDKSWKELDFDEVDFDSGNWSWGSGGGPLSDNEHTISHVSDGDLHETRYKMPDCINNMMKTAYDGGKHDLQQKYKNLMDL